MHRERVQVGRLAAEDVTAAGTALARAFDDSPLTRYCLPDPEERARRMPGLFAGELEHARRIGAAFAPSGEISGAACGWAMPLVHESDPVPEDGTADEAAASRFAAQFTFLDERLKRLAPPAFWYLALAGVDPSRQGQGVGSALVRAVLARADADRLPVCLSTDRAVNVAFYERLGFAVIDECVEPVSGLHYWFFRRDPV